MNIAAATQNNLDAKRRSSDSQQRGRSHRPCSVAASNTSSAEELRAGAIDDAHQQQRVLAVKVEIVWKDPVSKRLYQRLRDLSWAAARYRNGFIRRRWAE